NAVLHNHKNHCHTLQRPSVIAQMSLLTYESSLPWAKAIKAAVVSKQMPPWFADPHYGQFRNAPKLTEADIHTLAAWVDSGAREGNPADKPTAIHWADGWRTKPDVVVSMRESFNVPAKGAGEIQSFMIPNPFKEDTWVTSIEIRPGDPSVVHHVIVHIPAPTPQQPFVSPALVTVCADCRDDAALRKVEADFAVKSVAVDKLRRQGGSSYRDPLAKRRQRLTRLVASTTMEAV